MKLIITAIKQKSRQALTGLSDIAKKMTADITPKRIAIFFAYCLLILISYLFIPIQYRRYFVSTVALAAAIYVLDLIFRKIFPGQSRYDQIKEKQRIIYQSLNRHQKFYLYIVILFASTCLFYLINAQTLSEVTCTLLVTYCIGVPAYDAVRAYDAIYKHTIGKALIAITFALSTNAAFSISGLIIGEITKVSATTFPHTLAFLATAAIPFLVLTAGVIFTSFAIVLSVFFLIFIDMKRNFAKLYQILLATDEANNVEPYPIQTVLFQIIFYVLLSFISFNQFKKLLEDNSPFVESLTRKSIYYLDMYPGIVCGEVSDQRIASLGDETFLIGVKENDKVRFLPPKKCEASK